MTTARLTNRPQRVLLAILGALALGAATVSSACGDEEAQARDTAPGRAASAAVRATRLGVQLDEWSVVLSTATFRSGRIAISAANTGALPHDLVLVRSEAPLKELPVKDNRVDEDAVTIVGRFQEFKSGEKEKQFELGKGRYLLICNLVNHYEQGMVAELTLD